MGKQVAAGITKENKRKAFYIEQTCSSPYLDEHRADRDERVNPISGAALFCITGFTSDLRSKSFWF